MKYALLPIIAFLSGMFGRMGGSGNYPRQVRIVGIPFLVCGFAYYITRSWWVFGMIPFMASSISTYWDEVFGYDNYWFHGFVIGLSFFPLAIVTGNWPMFGAVVTLMCLWMGFWSKMMWWDVGEEFVRYCIIPVGVTLLTV